MGEKGDCAPCLLILSLVVRNDGKIFGVLCKQKKMRTMVLNEKLRFNAILTLMQKIEIKQKN